MKKLNYFILLFTLVVGMVGLSQETTNKLKTDSIYNLNSVWTSHGNEKKRLSNFLGQQVLIAMAYTSCRATCPMITSKMQAIEMANSKTKKLKILVVSFDPDRDTPENLMKYFKKMKLRDNWFLLTGGDSEVRDLAAVLGVNYKKDAGGEFSHSNIITLLGPDGTIKTQLRSLNEDVSPLVQQVN